MMPDDGNDYTGYYNTSGIGTYCTPVESRTLTANNPGEPRKPSLLKCFKKLKTNSPTPIFDPYPQTVL